MAAVTGPEYSFPPPAGPSASGRRRSLIAVVVAWLVVVVGLAVWSVRRDPATVPEQRSIAQALPQLQRAVGVVFAAAGGSGRAVLLGDLKVSHDCQITPVRAGVTATRDVVVYVRTGEVRAGIEAIAAALPKSYRASLAIGRGGTDYALHADAGNFIGVDADLDSGEHALALVVSSGCRPPVSGEPDRSDPATGPAPAALGAVLAALGAPRTPSGSAGLGAPSVSTPPGGAPSVSTPPGGAPSVSTPPGGAPSPVVPSGLGGGTPPGVTVEAVACPRGGTAGTYTVDGVAAPADLGGSLQGVLTGTSVISSGPGAWAYRMGSDSVVVQVDGKRLRVSASTAC